MPDVKNVKDETVVKIDDQVKPDDKKDELPPELKSAQETSTKVNKILSEHGYSSLDEMIGDLAQSQSLRKEVGDRDVKKLLAAQEELDKIHAYWAEQELLKAREDETAEDRAARLEGELKKQLHSKKQEEQARIEQEKSDKAWQQYDKDISTFISSNESTSDEKKALLETLLKRDSFVNDVDVGDRAAVREMTAKLNSMLDKYAQATIEQYRKGKVETPKIPGSKEPVTINKEDKPKNIKDAKRFLTELLAKKMIETNK